MKNKSIILLLSLAAAVTVFSCTKEKVGISTINGVTQVTAIVEQPADTKTNIGSATEGSSADIVWTADDKFSVLYGDNYSSKAEFTLDAGAGTSIGSFKSTTEVDGNILAVYPHSSGAAYSDGTITLDIPETQAYTFPSFAPGSVPMVAVGTADSPLTFKYLFSTIAFKVNGLGKKVTKVTVSASVSLWGPAEISVFEGAPRLIMTGMDSKYRTVTLSCSESRSISFDRVFFIAVPAGTYVFAVNVYCDDGTIFHENYATAKTFTAGKIKYNSAAKVFTDNGPAYVEGDYIGQGIRINGKYWAPVNCGYDSGHTCGLLYQWGRKYGQAYDAGTIIPEQLTMTAGQLPGNADKFGKYNTPYYNWFSGGVDNSLWPSGSRGAYDPCPAGWRVPTSSELSGITSTKIWVTNGGPANNQAGYLYGSAPNQIFFPAAGRRRYSDGGVESFGTYGIYWSSTVNAAYPDIYIDILIIPQNPNFIYRNYRAYGFSVRCIQE